MIFQMLTPKCYSQQVLINRECRRIGLKRQFSRLTIDFSLEGFNRLRNIAEYSHLASSVEKLSYKVPRFHLQSKFIFYQITFTI